MQFPLEMPPGKRIPFWSRIPGRSFRLRPDPETASHSGAKIWDALSAGIPPTANTTKEGAPFQPFEDRLYPRVALSRPHISANEISLTSPLLSAVSRHPCVKPRFEKIT